MFQIPFPLRNGVAPLLLALALPAGLAAQSRYVEIPWDSSTIGTNTRPVYGQSVCGIRDIDGDGIDDVLLGSPVTGIGSLVGIVTLRSGRTGRVLYEVKNGQGWSGFARTVETAGDLDGDGFEDFFVGSTDGPGELYSGRDGSFLRNLVSVPLGIAPMHFGRMPDLDGDGVPELLIGNANATTTIHGCCIFSSQDAGIRRVQLLDGATGAVLLEVNPPATSLYGSVLGSVGDVDGDGLEDFGVGAAVADTMGYVAPGPAGVSGFDVYSSATGALIWTVPSVVSVFERLGDLDGDGVGDLALGGMQIGRNEDAVEIRSGASGALLHTFVGRRPADGFGLDLAASDWDGDGEPELIVGADDRVGFTLSYGGLFRMDGDGYVQVIDVGTNQVLQTFDGEPEDWGLGAAVVAIGDATGDGKTDIAALAAWSDSHIGGTLRILSQSPLRIRSSASELSVAAGGTLTFEAKLGASHAGDLAILLGSASGPTPPTVYQGVTVPLIPDPYSRFLFRRVSPIVLDGSGEGTVALHIPAAFSPALVGLTLDHGFLVLDPTTKSPVDTTWSVPVVFTD